MFSTLFVNFCVPKLVVNREMVGTPWDKVAWLRVWPMIRMVIQEVVPTLGRPHYRRLTATGFDLQRHPVQERHDAQATCGLAR